MTQAQQQQEQLLLLQGGAVEQQQLLGRETQGSRGADWMVQGNETTLQEDGSSSSSSSGTGVLSRSSSTGSVSSSSSSNRGMYAGAWTSDTLAEMFEGVVGALLLDCGSDYDTLQQLLLPWVASSLDASKQATAAEAATAASASAAGALLPASIGCVGDLQQIWLQQLQELHIALEEQLQQQYGVYFGSPEPLAVASQHMLQVLKTGQSCAEAETLKFLGFGILQFTAALQAYSGQHGNWRDSAASGGMWRHPLLGQQVLLPQAGEGWHAGCSSSSSYGSSSSSSSRQVGKVCRKGQVVHQMSKHAAGLTTVRHR
jgi:hypothetical protein